MSFYSIAPLPPLEPSERPARVGRRRFVAVAGGSVAGLICGPALIDPAGAARPVPRPGPTARVPANVFTLGVASGDPSPDGVVLWTRLAPDPVHGGGMPNQSVPVTWEIADDERFQYTRRSGTVTAEPGWGHSVHAEVSGLEPDRVYFYRFLVAGQVSPVGRTRTAPAVDAQLSRLRFAFASCQDYQAGRYTAYQHLAAEDLAFVAFLGDYIYENPRNSAAYRQHDGTAEPYTLTDYRNRHACYKSDPDLRAAHAAVPWIVTFDDHEIDNNWADELPQDPAQQSPEVFRARRAAAFQAYYEHMPLRRSSLPRGLDMRAYRQLTFGRLAALHVLDTRQYRSDQPGTLAQADDPARTMTGAEQEQWLTAGMSYSDTRWNLLASQVMWASNDRTAGPAQSFDFDNWDGYRVQRRRLLDFFGSGATSNPVVLTGDRHATWACDLRPDFDRPDTPAVAAEITGTSISSGGDPDTAAFHRTYDPIKAESPHWKYIDNRRGYLLCELTADRLLASLRTVSTVWAPTAGVTTAAQFQVTAGRLGLDVLAHDTPPAADPAALRRYAVDDDQP
ncbi:alkaline phosphatase D family protein [Couchioplanes caeruleus]|uniref:Alkaline phosphatase D n=1 Tax=Couchioplanes caeruleus TaxID=56438 RepID=A0A3N1GD95_9ACTN|nr:alkaline phosphatase D family protein [Couchioplanes caeruleus]ROP28252.1 alkaline phosphatase D [Couchioplanes caeruleus]